MKRTRRNMILALGLASSLVLPGLALADNGHEYSRHYSPKMQPSHRHDAFREHDRDRHHEREYAHRDGYARHEWREHHRWQRFERYNAYRRHEEREHARRYYRWHRQYGYDVHPGAFVEGAFILPAPRLVIDLR